MKKILRILLFLLCTLFALPIFSQVYKVDVKKTYSWDSAIPDWQQDITEQFTYDNGGNKETKILGLFYPSLENDYQYIKTYNTNNDITLSVYQIWNDSLMQWEDVSQNVYTYYTGTSNIKDVTTYGFNLGYDIFKISYEYLGTDIIKITTQEGSSGSLINYEKFEYTYNMPGEPYQEFESVWNTTSSLWDLIEKTTAAYVGGLRTELLVESYNGSLLEVKERYLSTYSGSLETEYLWQSWVDPNWVNEDRELSTYDGNGNKIVYIVEIWDGSAWDPDSKEETSYSVAAPLSIVSFENERFKVYPNPTSTIINISSKVNIDRIEMFDVLGKKVLSSFENKQINIENFKSGVYVLKAFSNNQSTTKRVLIK